MAESRADEPFTGGLVNKAFEVQSLRRMYAREEGQAMNERHDRFEKWARDYFGLPAEQSWQMILNGGAGGTVVRQITIAHLAWQAALSPAGTGQPDDLADSLVASLDRNPKCVCGHRREMHETEQPYGCFGRFGEDDEGCECEGFTYPVRDSVKGEGETAPPECGVCGAKPGEKGHGADAMGNVHHVPSAPSPEELARDKFAELRSFLTNMRRDAADAEDPELSEYAQAIEQRLDELAALLRARGERPRPKCDYTELPALNDTQLCQCRTCQQYARDLGLALPAPPREGEGA